MTCVITIIPREVRDIMSPGIGLMKRRLPTKKEAIPVAVSGIIKKYSVTADQVKTLETKYDEDSGDWYVALGFNEKSHCIRTSSTKQKLNFPRQHSIYRIPHYFYPDVTFKCIF